MIAKVKIPRKLTRAKAKESAKLKRNVLSSYVTKNTNQNEISETLLSLPGSVKINLLKGFMIASLSA